MWEVGVFEEGSVGNVWVFDDGALSPEVGGVVFVGGLNGSEGGLDEVTSGSGLSFSLGVDVLNTGELEELLGDWWSDQTGTSWSWYKSDLN